MPTEEPAGPSAFYREDLADLAEYEFRIAQQSCVGCAEYHALWGYGRLAGINDGVAIDAALMAPVLARLAGPGARILIAGAADAGLLALAAAATRQTRPNISVADRCETPLAVCRRFAQAHALAITTLRTELAAESVQGRYDLILTHNLLLFVPPSARSSLLRNLASALSDRGRLVLANRMPLRQRRGIRPQYRNNANLWEALAARRIGLPESETAFRQRVARLAAAEGSRERALDRKSIEKHLLDAGLNIRERIEHDRRRAITTGGEVETVPTYLFVASIGD
jgi:hypothetical protein